jgi:hypothetical protein
MNEEMLRKAEEVGRILRRDPQHPAACLHGVSLEEGCARCAESYGNSRVVGEQRVQHPGIAALVERLESADPKTSPIATMAACHAAAAALRPLMRPDAATENLRAAWVALRMIREAVEQQGVGLVAAGEHLDGPTAEYEAEAIIAGVVALGQEAARLRERLADLAGKVKLHKEAIRFDFSRDCESARHEMWAAAERALAAAAGTEE